LERHRIIRTIWESFPEIFLSHKTALQFSLDPSVNPQWFLNLEISIYGHRNSLDIQSIDRSDETFDIIICNQILVHVKRDTDAFRELMRVLKPEGFLQLTVPNPIFRKKTEDWGYPNKDFHGHYRHYGLDLIEKFNAVCPSSEMVFIKSSDVITGSEDYVFFWSKSADVIEYLKSMFKPRFDVMN